MIDISVKTKYNIIFTTKFKKSYKKVMKQGKDKNKLKDIITKLGNGEILEERYKNHQLIDDKRYKDCMECHLEPDWLLIYKYINDELILLIVDTGSHSDLFNK